MSNRWLSLGACQADDLSVSTLLKVDLVDNPEDGCHRWGFVAHFENWKSVRLS